MEGPGVEFRAEGLGFRLRGFRLLLPVKVLKVYGYGIGTQGLASEVLGTEGLGSEGLGTEGLASEVLGSEGLGTCFP